MELDVLLPRQVERAVGELGRETGEGLDLPAGEVAEEHVRLDDEQPLLALRLDAGMPAGEAAVAPQHPGLGASADRGLGTQLSQALEHRRGEALRPPLLDEELEARLRRPVAEAVLAVRVGDRLGDGQHLVGGHEVEEEMREARVRRQRAAEPELEPGAAVAGGGDEAEVVDLGVGHAAVAAGDVDVEPSRQAGVVAGRVGEEEVVDLHHRRPGLEGLARADPGAAAADDVAHRVAARRAGGEAERGGPLENLAHPATPHRVELEVLAGGDVGLAVGEPRGEVRHPTQPAGLDPPAGDADPDHVQARGALAADAPGLEAVELLGGEAVVALALEAVEVDVEALTLDPLDIDPLLPQRAFGLDGHVPSLGPAPRPGLRRGRTNPGRMGWGDARRTPRSWCQRPGRTAPAGGTVRAAVSRGGREPSREPRGRPGRPRRRRARACGCRACW